MTEEWKPRIVAFFCNWCTYTAADLAGVSRLKYATNIRVIRLMCSGRVDPQFILDVGQRPRQLFNQATHVPCELIRPLFKVVVLGIPSFRHFQHSVYLDLFRISSFRDFGFLVCQHAANLAEQLFVFEQVLRD